MTTPETDRVDILHECYEDLAETRGLYRRVMSGADELIENAEVDLPKLPAESDESYKLRKDVATLNNYTRKAVKVMTGHVFSASIEFGPDVPGDIQKLCENVDKQGNHINIFARDSFEQGVFDGYGVILVDAPSTKAKNFAQQRKLNLKPFARFYSADSITKWRYATNPVTQARELAMLVLVEITNEPSGRFGSIQVKRWRHYFLDDAGRVFVEIWRQPDDEKAEPALEVEPRMVNVSEIPAAIIAELGKETPMYDVAKKNREHFQTYSEFKSLEHKTCVPQRVLEGGSSDSVAPIGGDITLFPPVGSKAYFIEVEGKSLEVIRQTLKDIADDIALMTNSFIANKNASAAMTATGEIIDNAGETAELRVMAESYKDTLERMLGFFAEFMNKGVDAGGSVILGTSWDAATAAATVAKNMPNSPANPMNPANPGDSAMVN